MIKSLARITLISLLALAFAAGPVAVLAADQAPETSARPYPFRGKIGSVDKEAKTITLEGATSKRTIHITASTKLEKGGKPATLNDAAAGEQVTGQCRKTSDGKEEAVSVYLGPRPGAGDKPAEK